MNDYQFCVNAFRIMYANPTEFRKGFDDWLWDNVGLQRFFNDEALAIAATGRDHYSAYTIVEYMRHHTALKEANSEYKINNNWRSSMARLFTFMYPQHADLFSLRELIGQTIA